MQTRGKRGLFEGMRRMEGEWSGKVHVELQELYFLARVQLEHPRKVLLRWRD